MSARAGLLCAAAALCGIASCDGGPGGGKAMPPSLIGVWKHLDAQGRADGQVAFGSDGMFSFDEVAGDGKVTSGKRSKYSANGAILVLDVPAKDGTMTRVTQQHYFNATRLALAALFPKGGTSEGIVALWKASSKSEPFDLAGMALPVRTVDVSYDLKGDGSAAMTRTEGGAMTKDSGTYSTTGGGRYEVKLAGSTQTLVLLDDSVLTTPVELYHR